MGPKQSVATRGDFAKSFAFVTGVPWHGGTNTTVGSGSITSTKQYVWSAGAIAEERNASNQITKRYFGQGQQVISGSTVTNYFFTFDHLGSVRELIANDGATIAARFTYDPYGRATQVSGSVASDLQYATMYYHANSGLSLTQYRAYNPNLGRWISRDPLGESAGLNVYAYCDNDPIDYTDPLGLDDGSFTPLPASYADLPAVNLTLNGITPEQLCLDSSPMAQSIYDLLFGSPSFIAGPFGENVLDNPIEMLLIKIFPLGIASDVHELGKGNPSPFMFSMVLMSMGDADEKGAASFFDGTTYTEKVLSQMQGGAGEFHSFPELVKNYESFGTVRTITGGDGVARQVLEIPGSYGGRNGVFQFIKNPDGTINHRLFVPQ